MRILDRYRTGALWLVAAAATASYYSFVLPWWVDGHASGCTYNRPGIIERVWDTWFGACDWDTNNAGYVAPSLLVICVAYALFFAALALDWEGGPPDWAVSLATFGFGALGAAAGYGVAWFVGIKLFASVFEPGAADPTILTSILLAAYGLVTVVAVPYFAGTRVYRLADHVMDGARGTAGGVAVTVGATFASAAGVAIFVAIATLVFMVAFIYAAVYVLMSIALVAGVTGAATVIRS